MPTVLYFDCDGTSTLICLSQVSVQIFSRIQLYAQEGTLLLRRYLYLIFQYCCDSDGEDEVVNLEPIYESSKSYHHRQLPDIIGTTDFLVREEFDIYK